jgi:hypothetical protein
MKRHLILAAISVILLMGLFSLLISRQGAPPDERPMPYELPGPKPPVAHYEEFPKLSPRVLASVYDYLYEPGSERPYYGLYSYVLFPIYSPRAERFLEELFKTTGYAMESIISAENLNVMYLPVRTEMIRNFSRAGKLFIVYDSPSGPSVYDDRAPPPLSPVKFAVQFYNSLWPKGFSLRFVLSQPQWFVTFAQPIFHVDPMYLPMGIQQADFRRYHRLISSWT